MTQPIIHRGSEKKNLETPMDTFSLTYDVSIDAWVLDLKPTMPNTISLSCCPPSRMIVAFGTDVQKARLPSDCLVAVSGPSDDPLELSGEGVTRCWKSFKQGLLKFLACCRPSELRGCRGKRRQPSWCGGNYGEMSTRDRDEKIKEAITYCKTTMRKDSARR